MRYLTKHGIVFIPTKKLVLTITPLGRYKINLPHKNSITYINRTSFENSLLLGTNPYYISENVSQALKVNREKNK